ncbi:MAG TPA: hypothetical protein VHT75_14250 [Acidimicrobiales bacterium]|nr:hypothetical protein [Acidimicrobiales bacterium]
MRPSQLWAVAAVVLAVTLAGCSSGSNSQTVPTAGSGPATTAAPAGGASPLAEGLAYSQCLRTHGVPNWPDPVPTPSGSYGYRTVGVNPKTAAFQQAQQACKALSPEWWSSSGQQLSPAQQQAWLNWAKCIRSHGVPDLPDPTFPGGGAVQIAGGGPSGDSGIPQSAMNACKAQMPTTGGLGG